MFGFYCSFGQVQKTAANVFHCTGCFKVKRMVQACILHKNNTVNAILKFLKERSQNSKKPVAFVSANANAKSPFENLVFLWQQ